MIQFKDVRIEVLSIDEAIQVCRDNMWLFDKVYNGRSTNRGKLMMLAHELVTDSENDPNYIIFADIGVGRIYWSKGSKNKRKNIGDVTFSLYDATRFSQDEAIKKVYSMNRSKNRSKNFKWKCSKLKNTYK